MILKQMKLARNKKNIKHMNNLCSAIVMGVMNLYKQKTCKDMDSLLLYNISSWQKRRQLCKLR